jgi:hypothetical protein
VHVHVEAIKERPLLSLSCRLDATEGCPRRRGRWCAEGKGVGAVVGGAGWGVVPVGECVVVREVVVVVRWW